MSSSPAGCGTEMTKQLVTGMAGNPNCGAKKQGGKEKKIRDPYAKDVSH